MTFIEPLIPKCHTQFEVFVALLPLAANNPVAPGPVLIKIEWRDKGDLERHRIQSAQLRCR